MILVYKHAFDKSLDGFLKCDDYMDGFTWARRLHMCLEIANGLNHLRTQTVGPPRIMHNDIRSAKILIDNNSEAKTAPYVISMSHPPNHEISMKVYEDPEYEARGTLTYDSDIYSFGVLFEILCGRVAYDPIFIEENVKGLAPVARQCFNDGTIERIVDTMLKEEMGENIKDSLYKFVSIVNQCLEEAYERPTMETAIKELEKALNFHLCPRFPHLYAILSSLHIY